MKNIILLGILIITGTSFSQTSNFWTKKNNFTGLKRERAVAFTIDDYAYVGTGVDTAEQVKNDFWKYDPIADTWSQVANLLGSGRRNAVAFTINGFGYVGTGHSSSSSATGTTLSDFWKYNPTSNSWTSVANYPGGFGNGVYFATGFSVNDKGYVCGGKLGPNNYISQLWEFNPATNNWIQKPSFPGGVRYQLASFTINNSGYVGLGTDNDLYRNDWWEYKPSSNQWIERANLPSSERSGVATFTIADRGFVCMGNNGGLLDDLWEYNPFEDEWEVRDNYGGSRRKWAVGFSLLGKGYVGLGKGYSGKKQSMYMYTPGVVNLKEEEITINIYPNPVVESFNISNAKDISNVEIYSQNGRKVMNTSQSKNIDVSNLPNGNYICIVKNNSGKIIGKQSIVIRK